MTPSSHFVFLTIASCALSGIASPPAQAQIILTGAHNNNPTPPGNNDGYDAEGPGAFIVPADAGDTPSATFNNNTEIGLYAENGATLTINGGQFNNDANGLYALNSDVTIHGGTFDSYNGVYAYGNALSITGGEFNGQYGLFTHAAVIITGGRFSNSIADFYVYFGNTSFDVYGQFDGLTPGQTKQLTVEGLPNTFTGTLQNETASQTFIYRGTGGTITLHDGALPEPTSAAILCGVSLMGLARRRRDC